MRFAPTGRGTRYCCCSTAPRCRSSFPDADGEYIRRVREAVGPRVPIGVALDMHGNISRQMVENADITTVYQTNPHLDAYEQAMLCARLLLRTVRGEIRPRSAIATPPLLVNILRQGTSDAPMSDLLRIAEAERRRPGVLSLSVVEGYPYSDVAEMGMSFIAITDNGAALAGQIARRLADAAWEMRAELNTGGTPVDEALMRAARAPAGPIVLFDVGDNVGGGSPGGIHRFFCMRHGDSASTVCSRRSPTPTPCAPAERRALVGGSRSRPAAKRINARRALPDQRPCHRAVGWAL